MTEEIQEQSLDLKQPSRIHRNQIIASIIATLTLIPCGLCFAWPTIYLYGKKLDVPVPPDKKMWVDAALLVGACLGPILCGLLIDRIGRKWFLYTITTPFLACWILTFFAKSWPLLFAGRLVAGISVGGVYTAVPIYNGEITETKVRGAASGIIPVLLNVGYILTYGVGPLLNTKTWALVNVVPIAIFGLSFLWMPESPYYYLKKQKEKQAEVSLTWLRGKIHNSEEITEMKALIENEKAGCIKEVFTVHRRAFLILVALLAGQQLSGLIAVESYARFILPNIDTKMSINCSFVIISALALITSIVTTLTVDRIGRKVVFLISAYGATISLLALGAYCFLLKHMKLDNLSWLPLVIIVVHCIIFSFGLSSVPAIVSSEIFPITVKSWATTFANIISFLIALIVNTCYRLIIDNFGYYTIFFAFGFLEFVTAILASIFMQETSGKPFANIQQIFNVNTNDTENKASTRTAEEPVETNTESA